MKFGLVPRRSSLASKWDPFDDMKRMHERLNRIFGEEGTDLDVMDIDTLSPLVDIKEEDDNIIVTTDLPGVDKKDVKIDVRDDRVWISADTHKESEEEKEGYLTRERTYKRFARSFSLPSAVKDEEAKAKLEDGVLTLTLPKTEIEEKHRIMIE